ncbi:LPS assembly lipoprotein LptE [Pyrinomonas methylaliphatogenes]|nr:LptE family protein [Pyrinomonas methylaliphatogenes]
MIRSGRYLWGGRMGLGRLSSGFARNGRRVLLLVTISLLASGFTECYKPMTRNGLPERIHVIAVPAFQNQALHYRIESRFTKAVMDELIRRGRGLRVQSERDGADAVIDGTIKRFGFSSVLLDNNGRARVFEVEIQAAVTVRDQKANKVLYDNQNYVFRGEFEFAQDPRVFFNEEDAAVDRIARSFAESLVSTLVNGFGAIR